MQDEELIERQPVSYHDTIGFLETAFRNIEFDAPMSNDDIEDVRQALNSVVAKRVAALAASPSPEISEPTKRMEKILDAPFVRRDASPTSLQNPQTSAPVVGDEGRREQNALALINEARRFSGLALISKLDELEPHQYRDQLRYADAIISPASISPVGDGAERCHRCGGNNPPWSAPSPLWNAVMRGGSIDGDALYGDMVCARCFMAIAEEKGIAKGWRVMAIDVRVDLETTTPAGRVWDAEQWLWVEPVEQIAENANCSDG